MEGSPATRVRASEESSVEGKDVTAMRTASMTGRRSAAAVRIKSCIAPGSARHAASSSVNRSRSEALGSVPRQSRWTISSYFARSAISSSGYPAMTSSPASPSTLLSRVSAATTSLRPGEKNILHSLLFCGKHLEVCLYISKNEKITLSILIKLSINIYFRFEIYTGIARRRAPLESAVLPALQNQGVAK